ncbi:GIY-YIG nuclease family protein, partial [Clostridium sp.]
MYKGIYKITNKINGKMYIGSSKNVFKRWGEHISQ